MPEFGLEHAAEAANARKARRRMARKGGAGQGGAGNGKEGRGGLRTSMWRSVALVNESMTIERTSDRGRCDGCDVPGAAFWFLKYICS